MPPKVLRFVTHHNSMVTRYESQHVRREFVGWKHDTTLGILQEDPYAKGSFRMTGGFVAHEGPEAIFEVSLSPPSPFLREYLDEARGGSLIPADAETHAYVDSLHHVGHPMKGKPFDPALPGAAMWGRPKEEEIQPVSVDDLHARILAAKAAASGAKPAVAPAPAAKPADKKESV